MEDEENKNALPRQNAPEARIVEGAKTKMTLSERDALVERLSRDTKNKLPISERDVVFAIFGEDPKKKTPKSEMDFTTEGLRKRKRDDVPYQEAAGETTSQESKKRIPSLPCIPEHETEEDETEELEIPPSITSEAEKENIKPSTNVAEPADDQACERMSMPDLDLLKDLLESCKVYSEEQEVNQFPFEILSDCLNNERINALFEPVEGAPAPDYIPVPEPDEKYMGYDSYEELELAIMKEEGLLDDDSVCQERSAHSEDYILPSDGSYMSNAEYDIEPEEEQQFFGNESTAVEEENATGFTLPQPTGGKCCRRPDFRDLDYEKEMYLYGQMGSSMYTPQASEEEKNMWEMERLRSEDIVYVHDRFAQRKRYREETIPSSSTKVKGEPEDKKNTFAIYEDSPFPNKNNATKYTSETYPDSPCMPKRKIDTSTKLLYDSYSSTEEGHIAKSQTPNKSSKGNYALKPKKLSFDEDETATGSRDTPTSLDRKNMAQMKKLNMDDTPYAHDQNSKKEDESEYIPKTSPHDSDNPVFFDDKDLFPEEENASGYTPRSATEEQDSQKSRSRKISFTNMVYADDSCPEEEENAAAYTPMPSSSGRDMWEKYMADDIVYVYDPRNKQEYKGNGAGCIPKQHSKGKSKMKKQGSNVTHLNAPFQREVENSSRYTPGSSLHEDDMWEMERLREDEIVFIFDPRAQKGNSTTFTSKTSAEANGNAHSRKIGENPTWCTPKPSYGNDMDELKSEDVEKSRSGDIEKLNSGDTENPKLVNVEETKSEDIDTSKREDIKIPKSKNEEGTSDSTKKPQSEDSREEEENGAGYTPPPEQDKTE